MLCYVRKPSPQNESPNHTLQILFKQVLTDLIMENGDFDYSHSKHTAPAFYSFDTCTVLLQCARARRVNAVMRFLVSRSCGQNVVLEGVP